MSGKSNMPGPAVSIASIIDHYTEKAQADRQAAYSGGRDRCRFAQARLVNVLGLWLMS